MARSKSHTSTSKPKRKDLERRIAELELANWELDEEKTRAREDLQETQQQLDNAQLQLDAQEHNGKLIPRPHGTPGDRQRGFILIDAIHLRNRPLQYRSIRRMVKSVMLRGNFDYTKSWRDQASRTIEQVCIVAAERQPFLRRFANDWATKAYMMIYLKNRRNYLRRQERLGLEPEPDQDSDDEAEGGENGAAVNDDEASVHDSDDEDEDD